MLDPSIETLRILDFLLRAGVPAGAASNALRKIEEGGSADEAIGACLDALESPLDLLLQVRAEALVIRCELAVRRGRTIRSYRYCCDERRRTRTASRSPRSP